MNSNFLKYKKRPNWQTWREEENIVKLNGTQITFYFSLVGQFFRKLREEGLIIRKAKNIRTENFMCTNVLLRVHSNVIRWQKESFLFIISATLDKKSIRCQT